MPMRTLAESIMDAIIPRVLDLVDPVDLSVILLGFSMILLHVVGLIVQQ